MRHLTRRLAPTLVTMTTAFEAQELVVPEDLTALSTEELSKLHEDAIEAFDSLYEEASGPDMSDETLAKLAGLTEAIEALAAEVTVREEAMAKKVEEAKAMADKVSELRVAEEEVREEVEEEKNEDDEGGEEKEEVVERVEDNEETKDEQSAESETLESERSEFRLNLSDVKREKKPAPKKKEPSMEDFAFGPRGEGMSWADVGKSLDKQLGKFNQKQYEAAAKANRHLQNKNPLVTLNRNFDENLIVKSNDQEHIESVFANAVDQSRLRGGSLVASGGWCAPSEVMYGVLETETRDGLFSLPEVAIRRGGLTFTRGPSFAEIYAGLTGFSFTEAEAIDGKFESGVNGNVVGDKPCHEIDCGDSFEVRLDVEGLCLSANILMSRGYPELQARIVRGALVAREHRTNALLLEEVARQSSEVTFPQQGGAAASILNAIELQVAQYRAVHRLGLNQTLEAVFPFWVRGVIRADLANRAGVDLISVPDARIFEWFRERGIAAQFTYNWQDLAATPGADTTVWPSTLKFLLYLAGTWVRGSQEVISIENLYDSVLLGQNQYTALFVEDGWAAIKRGHDSRVVEVPLAVDGAVGQAIAFETDGTRAATD